MDKNGKLPGAVYDNGAGAIVHIPWRTSGIRVGERPGAGGTAGAPGGSNGPPKGQ